MSLLIDRIDPARAVGIHTRPEDARAFLDASTKVFEVSNVVDLALRTEWVDKPGGEDAADWGINYSKFPNVAPPFDTYWFEWAVPAAFREQELSGSQPQMLERFGVWMHTLNDSTEDDWHLALWIWIGLAHRPPHLVGSCTFTIDRATGIVSRRTEPAASKPRWSPPS